MRADISVDVTGFSLEDGWRKLGYIIVKTALFEFSFSPIHRKV